MKFIIYLLSLTLVLLPSCKTRDKGKEKPEKKVEEAEREKPAAPEINFQEFESEEYDFDFKYPADWTYESFSPASDQFILNFFEKEKKNKLDLPILVHTNADNSFIGFYPEGYGTELPVGKSRPLNEDEIEWITFNLNTEKSEVFTLENGQAWAYFLVPSSPPPGWDEYGFIFAQSAIRDFSMICLDGKTGEEKSTQECDPMMGDEIKIFGNITEENMEEMKEILGSIGFR